MRYERIKVAELFSYPEFPGLVDEYMAESGNLKLPKNPQIEIYQAIEDAGRLGVVAVFNGSHLVGFAVFILTVLPHYSTVTASVESIFITKKQRKGAAGLVLIEEMKRYAKDQGAQGVYIGCRVGSRLERLLEKLGKEKINSVFYEGL